MIRSLRSRIPSPWIATLAVVISALLILGQIFHCCRINEAFASLITHGWEHLEGSVPEEGPAGHPPLVTHHAACHGAGPMDGEASSGPIETDEPCLSEADLALEGVQPGSSGAQHLFSAPRTVHTLPRLRSAPPPPLRRDSGDLPPYLLTLRLLV